MSSEQQMSDARFTNVFSVMIGGLIILTIVLIILSIVIGSGVKQSSISASVNNEQIAERLQPAGQLNIGEASAVGSSGSGEDAAAAGSGGSGEGAAAADSETTEVASGESVYDGNCGTCHNTGVAGAPTQGDSEAWSDRIDKGIETLYQHAIEGFQGSAGVMPPKGGNPGLSDEEVKAAVDFMVESAE